MELDTTHLLIAIISFYAGMRYRESAEPSRRMYTRKKPTTAPPDYSKLKGNQNIN